VLESLRLILRLILRGCPISGMSGNVEVSQQRQCRSNAKPPFSQHTHRSRSPPDAGAGRVGSTAHLQMEPPSLETFLTKNPTRKHSPPQVPDVSAVLHTSDFPCLKANRSVPDIEFRQDDSVVRALDLIDDPSGSN